MPANTSPIYPLTPRTSSVAITAANTARDGSGTINSFFTASTNGSVLNRIIIQNATTAAVGLSAIQIARIYISDAAGSNWRLYKEVYVQSVTMGNGTIGAIQFFEIDNGLMLTSGQQVGATISQFTSTALDKFNITGEGSDF